MKHSEKIYWRGKLDDLPLLHHSEFGIDKAARTGDNNDYFGIFYENGFVTVQNIGYGWKYNKVDILGYTPFKCGAMLGNALFYDIGTYNADFHAMMFFVEREDGSKTEFWQHFTIERNFE